MMKSNEIRAIYLYEYKRGLKASGTARTMNETFDPNIRLTMVQRV